MLAGAVAPARYGKKDGTMGGGGESVKLPRASKGKRPYFFDDPAIDQVMTFVLELMAETSTLRDRLDTVERLLDSDGHVTRAAIEAYQPDPAVEIERTAWRQAFIQRVLRMHVPS